MAHAYFAKLTGAPYKRFVELGEGTHTVMLEKNRSSPSRDPRISGRIGRVGAPIDWFSLCAHKLCRENSGALRDSREAVDLTTSRWYDSPPPTC